MVDEARDFEAPEGWQGGGQLPLVDGDALPRSLRVEDLLQLEGPDGVVVDVGWLPHGDPEGQFVGLVVEDFDWAAPVVRFETRSATVLREWLAETLSEFGPPQQADFEDPTSRAGLESLQAQINLVAVAARAVNRPESMEGPQPGETATVTHSASEDGVTTHAPRGEALVA